MEKMAFFNRGKQSREEQFLLNVFCLSTKAGSDYRESLQNSFFALDEERLWQLSLEVKVTAVFAHRLANIFGWENIPPRWRKFHDNMAEQVKLYNKEIDLIARELNACGIRVIALKNNVVALAFPVCLGCCQMSDIDILIENTNQQQADIILGRLGYNHYWTDNSIPHESDKSTDYFKIAPSGQFIFLDIHWEAIGVRCMKGNLGEVTSKMMERSQPIPGTTVRIFSPEDNLFQVVVHNAKHAFRQKIGFMGNLDVHRIIENQEINWTVFLNLVRAHKINTVAYFSLLAPAILIGTPVPAEVLGALTPSSWKKPLFRFVRSAWFPKANKNKLRSFIFRIAKVILYDNIKIVIRNSIRWIWLTLRKWRDFYFLRSKVFGLLPKSTRFFAAFPIVFQGPGSYKKDFKGTGYGIVFEDDGQEGYVYTTFTTKKNNPRIFGGLRLYEQGNTERISKNDLLKILWHPKLKKVGIMYHGKIRAIFDFKRNEIYSMDGCYIRFPLSNPYWYKQKNHLWDDIAAAEFEGII